MKTTKNTKITKKSFTENSAEESQVSGTEPVKVGETTGTDYVGSVDLHNPGFDPDIPEQKQRWLR